MNKTDLKFSDEYKTLEILKGTHKGTYKAKGVAYGCKGCAFHTTTCALPAGSKNKRCSKEYKVKDDDTIWVDNFIWIKTEETPKPTPRTHANLIKQWVNDANLKVWEWFGNKWNCIVCPTWDKDIIYAVSIEKPTWTPMKKYSITIGTFTTTISLSSSLTEEELEKAIKDYTASLVSYKEV